MGNFKFTIKNKKRKQRRWACKKNVTLQIETPGRLTINKTKKRIRATKEKILKMKPDEKKQILESQGLLKPNSSAPQDLINTMLTTLV